MLFITYEPEAHTSSFWHTVADSDGTDATIPSLAEFKATKSVSFFYQIVVQQIGKLIIEFTPNKEVAIVESAQIDESLRKLAIVTGLKWPAISNT